MVVVIVVADVIVTVVIVVVDSVSSFTSCVRLRRPLRLERRSSIV